MTATVTEVPGVDPVHHREDDHVITIRLHSDDTMSVNGSCCADEWKCVGREHPSSVSVALGVLEVMEILHAAWAPVIAASLEGKLLTSTD